jgi:hypothetical protein
LAAPKDLVIFDPTKRQDLADEVGCVSLPEAVANDPKQL